jgi:hypothetical protein
MPPCTIAVHCPFAVSIILPPNAGSTMFVLVFDYDLFCLFGTLQTASYWLGTVYCSPPPVRNQSVRLPHILPTGVAEQQQ